MSPFSLDVGVDEFATRVIAASHNVPVIVDFWAPWCQPCRTLKPLLEKLAAEYEGRFLLAKINSDENQALAQQYGVRGIPAVKAFVNGDQVDEFSGALPEAQLRDFINRILPSPAEPLRLEALALAADGDRTAALRKLDEALQVDPANEAARLDCVELRLDEGGAGALAEARQLLDAIAARARDGARVEALQARLQLAAAGDSGADIDALQATLEANGDNLDNRLALANALALRGDYRPALQHLLQIVRRDRAWNDEAGRKGMLNIFQWLAAKPEHATLLREFRIALARTLN